MNTKVSHVQASAKELLYLLARALNTLEPKDTPKWALDLSDGLLATDEVTITVKRNVDQVRSGPAAQNQPA